MVTFFSTNPTVSQGMQAYNAGLSKEAVARMQADAAIREAEIYANSQRQAQADANRQFFAQQQFAQQQAAQDQAYKNAVLENQRAQSSAQMENAKALMQQQLAESQKDRDLKRELGVLAFNAKDQTPAIQAEQNNLALMANSYASNLNELDELQRQADELAALKAKTKDLPGIDTEAKRMQFFNQLPYSVPADRELDFNSNLGLAESQLTRRIQELSAGINPNREVLQPYVQRGQNGKWMATLQPVNRPAIGNGQQFFAPAPTGVSTNAPATVQGSAPAAPNIVATNAVPEGVTNPRVIPVGPQTNAPAQFFGNGGGVMANLTPPPEPTIPAMRQIGGVYMTRRGPMLWDGIGWVQP